MLISCLLTGCGPESGAGGGAGMGGGSTGTGGGGAGSAMTTGGGGAGGAVTTGGGGAGGAVTTGGGGAGGTTTTPSGPGSTLAVRALRLGDTLPNGTPAAGAWKGYGFNIDGKVSTEGSADLCQPYAGGKKSAVYPDGDGGIDNSFGKNVFPIFLALTTDFSTLVNGAIEVGDATILTEIEGISPGATGTFASKLYTGGFGNGVIPKWDGLDAWPVRSDSLVNGDIANPKAQFPTSKVTADPAEGRVWESKGFGDLRLAVPMGGGMTLVLPIRRARMSMVLSADNSKATLGKIGGVIDTEELIAEITNLVGSLDASLCPPSSVLDSILLQIRQASDSVVDGPQDPAVTCDGISIGLGFAAESAALGAVFAPPPWPDPCSP